MGDRGSDGSGWSGWLLPGAILLIAAVLLIYTLMPRAEPTPSPSIATPAASPGDEHEVVTDEGVVSFRFDGKAIIVRLQTDAGTTELTHTDLPFIATAPPSGTPAPTGTSIYAMVCGPVGTPEARRYVFGFLDEATKVEYSGPQAVGHTASDGLFLYALVPGVPSGAIMVQVKNGPGGGYPGDVFDQAASEGKKQPSGCYVVG